MTPSHTRLSLGDLAGLPLPEAAPDPVRALENEDMDVLWVAGETLEGYGEQGARALLRRLGAER